MSVLCARAPGKVNLCLFLGPLRPDGRHDLVSVLEAVSLHDDVRMAPAPAGTAEDEVLCPAVEGPNLAALALRAFRREIGWDAPPQRVTITKRVPLAAGMGGGSADAAATLRLAAHASGRDGDRRLDDLAASLGSDVPAAMETGAALVTGAGEQVRRLAALEAHGLLVLPSSRRLSTADVFAEADRLGLARGADDLADVLARLEAAAVGGRLPGEDLLVNDLEPAARSLCPEIDAALEAAREAGADRALATGSGPTAIGLFLGPDGQARASAAARRLAASFPAARAATPVEAGFGAPRADGVPA